MSEQADKGEWPTNELPDTWTWVKFGEVWDDATSSHRKLKQKDYLPEGRLAVVDQGEQVVGGYTDEEDLRSEAPAPCIIFGDHTRAVKFVDFPFAQGADGVRVLVPSTSLDPAFGYLGLCCIKLPNKGYSRHFKFLKSSTFPVPPLAEQRRIVAKLDRLSAKRSAAERHLARISKLAARAKQSILAAAFRGDLTANVPTETLGSLSTLVTSGSRGWKRYYSDAGATFIRVGNVQRSTIELDLSEIQHVTLSGSTEGVRTKLRHGDLVVTITADLGRVGVVPPGLGEAYVNQHVALVRPVEGSNARYLAWFLTSGPGQDQLFERDRGMTRAGLGLDDIRAVAIPMPGQAEQSEIVRRIEAAFARIDRLTEEASRASHLLARLDERLLAKAFRGELVPQEPTDEPASALLNRIRAERAEKPMPKRGRRKKIES